MNLSGDQCGVIAQLLPVLLLASVIEQRALIRHLRVGRWDPNTLSAPIYTIMGASLVVHLSGVALAVAGMPSGLRGIWAIWLTLNAVSSGIILALMTIGATLVEQSASTVTPHREPGT